MKKFFSSISILLMLIGCTFAGPIYKYNIIHATLPASGAVYSMTVSGGNALGMTIRSRDDIVRFATLESMTTPYYTINTSETYTIPDVASIKSGDSLYFWTVQPITPGTAITVEALYWYK